MGFCTYNQKMQNSVKVVETAVQYIHVNLW